MRLSASNFPGNFASVDLRLSSTVEYYGGAQTITAQTYGNLLLTGNGGAAVKTMPATAFRIEQSDQQPRNIDLRFLYRGIGHNDQRERQYRGLYDV